MSGVATAVSLSTCTGDATVWSKRYERPPEKLLSSARRDGPRRGGRIADFGRSRRRGRAAARPGSRHAFHLCLKGRFYWSKRYEGGLQTARQCFEEAIALDSVLAAAHAGLADTYSFLGFYCLMRPRTAFDLARSLCGAGARHWIRSGRRTHVAGPRAPGRRLGLGGAHVVVSSGPSSWTRPTASTAFTTRGCSCCWAGPRGPRRGRARPGHRPAVAGAQRRSRLHVFLSRGYERAIRECERALEIDREFLVALYVMAMCKAQLGLLDEAIAEMEHVVALTGGCPSTSRCSASSTATPSRPTR